MWAGLVQTVTFVPATPGGELTCLLQEEGQRLGLNIRAVEQGGTSLKRKLTGGDLKGGELCGQPDCLLQVRCEGRLSSEGRCAVQGNL